MKCIKITYLYNLQCNLLSRKRRNKKTTHFNNISFELKRSHCIESMLNLFRKAFLMNVIIDVIVCRLWFLYSLCVIVSNALGYASYDFTFAFNVVSSDCHPSFFFGSIGYPVVTMSFLIKHQITHIIRQVPKPQHTC